MEALGDYTVQSVRRCRCAYRIWTSELIFQEALEALSGVLAKGLGPPSAKPDFKGDSNGGSGVPLRPARSMQSSNIFILSCWLTGGADASTFFCSNGVSVVEPEGREPSGRELIWAKNC